MDQDTSNSPGKARWRERLGMGGSGKDLPKISDEFKPASAPPRPAPPRPQPSAQGHQAVTRPAPMAPRTPAPMAPRMPPRAQAQAPQAQPPAQPQARPQQQRPVAPLPQGASGLGDRLRAERQAAERLAEQRVAQARGGSRPMTPPPVQPAPQPAAPAPQSQRPAQPERPKFSFSAEELAKDKRETVPPPSPSAPPEREYPTFSGKTGGAAAPPPLTPPRPALGGNAAAQSPRPQPPKPQANPPPSAGPAFQPRYGAPPPPPPQQPAPNYRSLDPPAGGGFTPKSRPYADTAAFREDPLTRREAPLPPPSRQQPPANREYDSYRRPPALPPVSQQAYGDELDGPALPDYRRRPPVPARSRQQLAPAYDEDVNEVFEDEEPPRPQRRRASAQDYNRAYRERDYEEGYEAEPRRRRGPWPWLLAILLGGIVLTGGIIYYYLTYMKNPGQANGGNVPVIEAPDSSSKAPPENTGGALGSAPGTNPSTDAQRKQIYDRILGDDEVNGNQNQVVPTQEQPQAVEPTGGNEGEGQGAAPLPTPSSGAQDNSSEPLPLPLPPPGATDQQGSLQNQTNQQTAAMGAVDRTTAPTPEPASTTTSDGGAPVPGQLAKATEQIASAPPPAAEQVVSEPEELPPQPQPAKPKLKAEKKPVKKTAAVEDAVDTGSEGAVEPLVLVPPAQQPVATTQPEPVPVQQATESAASEQKSKSFFNNLGSGPTGKRKLTGKAAENAQARGGATGNWANAPDPNAVQADSSGAEPQQIAAIAPAPEPQPIPTPEPEQPVQKAKPSSGGGFTAQLASFRSEAEAQAEFDRLRAKHGGVLGSFSPRIVKATVAGSPRYRLSVGPMASRAQASKVCDSLIAGGERDCLVRGN